MDYGQTLDDQQLKMTRFRLPPLESAAEQEQLARLRRAGARHPLERPRVRVGAPVWGEAKWVGTLYPKGTKSSSFLRAYQARFKTVEINSTFYAIPALQTFRKWADTVDADFRFCPKFPKSVSHRIGSPDSAELEHFYEGLECLKERIGVTFLQLPSTYHADLHERRADQLLRFLETVPRWVRPGVEFRNPVFIDGEHHLKPGWVDALADRFAATVLIDTPAERPAFHASLSATRVMVRFLGANLHETDTLRLDEWVARILTWLENGLQELYFIVHQPDLSYAPGAVRYLIRRLGEETRRRELRVDLAETPSDRDFQEQGRLL